MSGTIAVSFINGFSPQLGNQFNVLTFSSRTGEFSTYNGLVYAAGKTFQTVYGAANFTLAPAVADIKVFPTTGLVTSKAGDFTTFTVALAIQPSANVTLNLSSSNTSEGIVSPASLIFTSANWNVPQTVTVTGINDGNPGTGAYRVLFAPAVSSDPNYAGLTPSAVSVAGSTSGGLLGAPIFDPISDENLYVVTQSSWTAAEAAAQAMGGNLVTIHNAAENTFIVSNVLQDFTSTGGPNLSDVPAWIGLYDPQTGDGTGAAHAADFQWVDGSGSSFRAWNSGEPNNTAPGEYDTAINWHYSQGGPLGTWNDAPNAGTSGFGGNTNGPYYGIVAVPAQGIPVTNLPNEVKNIAVTNLAVNPSTGLNQGSILTITWNDSNTGNLPAAASWDDQVVITNTTTGDHVDHCAGPRRSERWSASSLRAGRWPGSIAFTLPTTADGVGNIQITVTANVNHYCFRTAGPAWSTRTCGTFREWVRIIPAAPTTLTVGGVDFALVPDGTSSTSLGDLFRPPETALRSTSREHRRGDHGQHADQLRLGVCGDTVGTVEVKGTGGADAIFNLVEGTNIRDYNNDGFTTTSCHRHALGVVSATGRSAWTCRHSSCRLRSPLAGSPTSSSTSSRAATRRASRSWRRRR